jgi:DnaJ-class molecular chaperone
MILEVCISCNGEGYKTIIFEYNGKNHEVYERCRVCAGKGKTDWVTNITKKGMIDNEAIGSIDFICRVNEHGNIFRIYDGKNYISMSSEKGEAIRQVFVKGLNKYDSRTVPQM